MLLELNAILGRKIAQGTQNLIVKGRIQYLRSERRWK